MPTPTRCELVVNLETARAHGGDDYLVKPSPLGLSALYLSDWSSKSAAQYRNGARSSSPRVFIERYRRSVVEIGLHKYNIGIASFGFSSQCLDRRRRDPTNSWIVAAMAMKCDFPTRPDRYVSLG